jgi:hypothetical protein
MLDLVTDVSPLEAVLESIPGVVAVVLGTPAGELHSVAGSFVDGESLAALTASLTTELAEIGAQLGFGDLEVVSLKAATAARVFTRQRGAVVAIELVANSPLGDLENKLRALAWDVEDDVIEPPVPSMTSVPTKSTAPPLPPASSSVSSGPVFTGDLEEFSLPDLLEFLRNSHRTGLLMCTTSTGVGTIQLSRGMVIRADSPGALDLREHFLTSPAIDPARRRVLATLPPDWFSDDLVEDVLVSRDLAAQDEVEQARIARIYSAFREMIRWTSGRFSFDPGVPIAANPPLALSTQSILMNIYQEQDEQGR